MDNLSNIEKLCQNGNLLKEALAQKTEQDVMDLLGKNGIPITSPELKNLKKLITLATGAPKPIAKNEMDEISGGSYQLGIVYLLNAITEATFILARSSAENSDSTGTLTGLRMLDEQSNPSAQALSWPNALRNATSGIRVVGREAIKDISAWWNN